MKQPKISSFCSICSDCTVLYAVNKSVRQFPLWYALILSIYLQEIPSGKELLFSPLSTLFCKVTA